MRFKIILITILVLILVFLIYITNIDKNTYYLNIAENNELKYTEYIITKLNNKKKLEKYVNQSIDKNYRTIDLINDIKNNELIINERIRIQNSLIKADLLTFSIGINDIVYYIENNEIYIYDYIDELLLDLDVLFKLIRYYCKEKIFFIGYHNIYGTTKDEIFNYLDYRISMLCKEYKINYINLNNKPYENVNDYIGKDIMKIY